MGTPGGWAAKPGALRGESQYLRWFKYPLSDLSDHWRERWAKPRAWRDDSYLNIAAIQCGSAVAWRMSFPLVTARSPGLHDRFWVPELRAEQGATLGSE